METTRNLQQLFDEYDALTSLRNAAATSQQWQRLNHEVRKARRNWIAAVEAATMRSDIASYKIEQGGTQQ